MLTWISRQCTHGSGATKNRVQYRRSVVQAYLFRIRQASLRTSEKQIWHNVLHVNGFEMPIKT